MNSKLLAHRTPHGASRRSFLHTVAVSAASWLILPSCAAPQLSPQIFDGKKFFPQSLASGDPRPDSIVFWTRVVDPARQSEPCQLQLQVATDEQFSAQVYTSGSFSVTSDSDHTLRVKVVGLQPRTTYFYRFVLLHDDGLFTSQTGRTRTAPSVADDRPVKFALWSCQDFEGRYYNAWQRLLQLDEDLDFVLGLGDYIYEKVPASPSSQPRSVRFSDPAQAIPVGSRLAAATVGQYRDLYKRYRSDAALQKVHERYPMICIWDDHEYANDCYGATSTDGSGKFSETNPDRRRHAERAFFEYMPVDDSSAPSGSLSVVQEKLFPKTRLFRDFRFGQRLHLILTDYRSFRPDHLIPEEAYPGTLALDAVALQALGAYPAFVSDANFAVIDIDAPLYAPQKQVLQQAAIAGCLSSGLSQSDAEHKAAGWVTGRLALLYVNAVLKAVNQSALVVAPSSDMERGVAWLHMGKQQLFSSQGSRNLVVKSLFELYALYQWQLSSEQSENVFGNEQRDWLHKTLTDSTATFRVIGSSVTLTEGILDLTQTPGLPASLRNVFLYGTDGWDGFPNQRQALLDFIKQSGHPNTLFVSGDIHAGFVSQLAGTVAVSLTTPAISSGTLHETVRDAALALGITVDSAPYKQIVANLNDTLRSSNPAIQMAASDQHGFVIVSVGSSEVEATYHLISQGEVTTDSTGLDAAALAQKFSTRTFKVASGTVTAA